MSTQDDPTAPPPRRPDEPGRTPQAAPAAPAPAEQVPYLDDPWTKVFVLLIAAVFVVIFVNAIFLGHGGLLTTTPTPSPTPAATASPSPTASPSGLASPTASPSSSGSPAPSPTPSPTASP